MESQRGKKKVVGKKRLEKDRISKLVHELISCTSTPPQTIPIKFRYYTWSSPRNWLPIFYLDTICRYVQTEIIEPHPKTSKIPSLGSGGKTAEETDRISPKLKIKNIKIYRTLLVNAAPSSSARFNYSSSHHRYIEHLLEAMVGSKRYGSIPNRLGRWWIF